VHLIFGENRIIAAKMKNRMNSVMVKEKFKNCHIPQSACYQYSSAFWYNKATRLEVAFIVSLKAFRKTPIGVFP
jgi:hypothetical protein